jgi:serine protease
MHVCSTPRHFAGFLWAAVAKVALAVIFVAAALTPPLTAQAPILNPFPVMSPERVLQSREARDLGLNFVPGEAIVRFRDGVTADGHQRALQAVSGRAAARGLQWIGEHALVRDAGEPDARALVAKLVAQPEVLSAELNYLGRTQDIPNDPSYFRQWNLQQLKMPAAWDIAPGATADVIVAIVDSGVTSVNAQTLTARTWNGVEIITIGVPIAASPEFPLDRFVSPADFTINEFAPTSMVIDTNSHGTHTAATVGQATNDGRGLAGIAYNARIMPLKVCSSDWDFQFAWSAAGFGGFAPAMSECRTSATAQAIRYAADHGANVINISLGGFPQSTLLSNALAYAVGRGAFIAISNGNSFDSGNAVSFPAAFAPQFDGVMSVAAVTRSDSKAWYSTTNAQTEIAAYGGDTRFGQAAGIWQTTIDFSDSDFETVIIPRFDRYEERSFQGTSMAAPHVAGFAALLHSRGVISPQAKEAVIIATALDLPPNGRDNQFGHGLIQPRAALFGSGIRR